MSAVVKLSAAMPGDPSTNGLDALVDDLVEEPDRLRVAMIWLDVAKVVIDTDTDAHVPTVRVRRIEPLGDAADVDVKLQGLIQDAIAKRTGRTPLPFGVVDAGADPDQLELEDGEE